MAIPEALERVILRCLEKKVEDRFQSAEELSCALAAVPLRRSWDNARASDWWQRNEPEVGRRRTTMAPSDRGLTAASRDTARRGTAYPQHRP
jgi:hypothetical protein